MTFGCFDKKRYPERSQIHFRDTDTSLLSLQSVKPTDMKVLFWLEKHRLNKRGESVLSVQNASHLLMSFYKDISFFVSK